jgi:hypothetical protein
MEKNLVDLINKIQSKRGEDAFEVSNHPILEVFHSTKEIKVVYDEGDLTKNFVKFATDLLNTKYGDFFLEDIIKKFGETLKTNKNDFKESYRNKPSSIKEILPSVFIHTSMSKVLMESLIIDLVTNARLTVKFFSLENNTNDWTVDSIINEVKKYNNLTSFIRERPGAYSAAVKMGMKETIQGHIRKNYVMTQQQVSDKKTESV